MQTGYRSHSKGVSKESSELKARLLSLHPLTVCIFMSHSELAIQAQTAREMGL